MEAEIPATSKCVRVFCDYGADGLWECQSGPWPDGDVPISPTLRQRIDRWQDWYERDCKDYDGSPPDLPFYDAHTAEGLQIAQALKAELPDWKVVFLDEAKWVRGLGNTASDHWVDIPQATP